MGRFARSAYVAGISIAGALVLGLVVFPRLPTVTFDRPLVFGVLVALLLVSEQFPIRFETRHGQDLVSLSGAFCCALLLHWDLSLAVLAQAVAALVHDVSHRVRWYKTAFNVAQFTLAVTAAGLLLESLDGGLGVDDLDARTVSLALLAGLTYFLVNHVLTGVALALEDGVPLTRFVWDDLPRQLAVNGGGIALTPLLVAAADTTLWLIPLLLFPLYAIHYSARARLQLDRQGLQDRLTGLPNQTQFRRDLVNSLDTAHPGKEH